MELSSYFSRVGPKGYIKNGIGASSSNFLAYGPICLAGYGKVGESNQKKNHPKFIKGKAKFRNIEHMYIILIYWRI